MKKILITGGFGFIGSALIEHFKKENLEIVILEHPKARTKDKSLEIIRADISDENQIKNLKIKNIDAVLHLAGQTSGPKSFSIPVTDIRLNLIGTTNMINFCENNSINKIILASSFVVYGDQKDRQILNEQDNCVPKSVYATSKLSAEYMLKNYAQEKKINWNVLRMFNVYGVGQDITKPDQGLVGIFMNMLKKGNTVEVKGSLDRFRDIVNISDVVQGWDLCLKGNCNNEIFNLGTGIKTTFRDLIMTLGRVMKKERELKILEKGNTIGDLKGCVASLDKIKNKLKYEPKVSLEKGLSEMWNSNKD